MRLKAPATSHSSSSPSTAMRWARSPASSLPAPCRERVHGGGDAAPQGAHHAEVGGGDHDQQQREQLDEEQRDVAQRVLAHGPVEAQRRVAPAQVGREHLLRPLPALPLPGDAVQQRVAGGEAEPVRRRRRARPPTDRWMPRSVEPTRPSRLRQRVDARPRRLSPSRRGSSSAASAESGTKSGSQGEPRAEQRLDVRAEHLLERRQGDHRARRARSRARPASRRGRRRRARSAAASPASGPARPRPRPARRARARRRATAGARASPRARRPRRAAVRAPAPARACATRSAARSSAPACWTCRVAKSARSARAPSTVVNAHSRDRSSSGTIPLRTSSSARRRLTRRMLRLQVRIRPGRASSR